MSDTNTDPKPAPIAAPEKKGGPLAFFRDMLVATEEKLRDLYDNRIAIARGVLKVDDEARAAVAIAMKVSNIPLLRTWAEAVTAALAVADKLAHGVLGDEA